jgi:hypothetical protein
MTRRTLARLAAVLGAIGSIAYVIRQRELARNAKRFGLPI